MKTIRLLVIEENRLLRDGILKFLEASADIQAIGVFGTPDAILPEIASFKPHVLLFDPGDRDQNGLPFLYSVSGRKSQMKVIVMNIIPTEANILQYIQAGVSGFIQKDATIPEFLKTIRSCSGGTKVLPTGLTCLLFSQIVNVHADGSQRPAAKMPEAVRLTRRERQVTELISAGMTNMEIANELHLSVYTVKSHVHVILDKLMLHTRVQIAKYAHLTGTFQKLDDADSAK